MEGGWRQGPLKELRPRQGVGLALAGAKRRGRVSGRRVRGQPDCAELSEEGGGIGGITGIWIGGPEGGRRSLGT